MPVIGTFHSFYWATQAPDIPASPVTSGIGGYPMWQAVVVSGWLWVCAACLAWLRRVV